MQYKAEPPEECLVNVVNEVSGEDDDAREALDVVEEHSHIHIGVAIRGGAGGRTEPCKVSFCSSFWSSDEPSSGHHECHK